MHLKKKILYDYELMVYENIQVDENDTYFETASLCVTKFGTKRREEKEDVRKN